MPKIYYVESSYGCEDDATLKIRWNRAKIIVNLFRNPIPNSSENSLIDKHLLASKSADEDAYTDAQDAILDAAVALGATEFDRLAPPPPGPPRQLHAILFPQQFTFRLVTVSKELKILLEGTHLLEVTKNPAMGFINVVSHPNPPSQLFEQVSLSIKLEVDDTPKLPRFSTEDIEVLEKLLGDD